MDQPSLACPHCGAAIQPDWLVCPHCAQALGESEVPPPSDALGTSPPPPVELLPAVSPLPPEPGPPPRPPVRRAVRPPDLAGVTDLALLFPVGTTELDLDAVASRALAAPRPDDPLGALRAAVAPELPHLSPEATEQMAQTLASMLAMQARMRQVDPDAILQEWATAGGRLTVTVESAEPGHTSSKVSLTSNTSGPLTAMPHLDLGSMSLSDASGLPPSAHRRSKSGCTVTTGALLLLLLTVACQLLR